MNNRLLQLFMTAFAFNILVRGGVLLILALPLLSWPPLFSPPDWGKTIVFRLVLSVLLILFVWQVLSGKQRVPKIAWKSTEGILVCLLVLFLGVFLLATVFSVDPAFSFWGDPYRSGGTLNLIFLILFALFLFVAFPQEQSRRLFTNGLLLTGAAMSFIAIMQWQGWFSSFFITTGARPPSTAGSSMALALFLLLLFFLALAQLAKANSSRSKMLYAAGAILFAFIMFLTETRAVLFGLAAGVFFFLFWYPARQKRNVIIFRSLLLGIFLAGSGAFLAANVIPSPPSPLSRLQFSSLMQEPRFAAWQVALKALAERPWLGYGPENFSVGFDKHYDPTLPGMDLVRAGTLESWWDRAHNIVLDIAMQAGIGAAVAFFAFFGLLFWGLHQVKKLKGQSALFAHCVQAALVGYLVAELFGFDTFSVQLILFFLIALSLQLISKQDGEVAIQKPKEARRRLSGLGVSSLMALTVALLWFNWQTAILPLLANAEINKANSLVEQKRCQEAFTLIEKSFQTMRGVLRSYAGLSYADALIQCQSQAEGLLLDSVQRGRDILQETMSFRPLYTRGWIALGGLTNIMLAQSGDPSQKAQLKQEAEAALQKALALGPKRQEAYVEWVKTFLALKDYEGARQKAKECLALNTQLGSCWFLLARAELSLGKEQAGKAAFTSAERFGYKTKSKQSILHLANAHLAAKNYPELAKIYELLTNKDYDPTNPKYHASLALTYTILGRNHEARKGALSVLMLAPTERETVRTFIRQIPGCGNEIPAIQAECYVISALTNIYLKDSRWEEYLKAALALQYPAKAPVYLRLGSWAKDAAENFVAAEPANASYRLALAIILDDMNDVEGAKKEALKTQELNPLLSTMAQQFIQGL